MTIEVTHHGMQPQPTHDESARQAFVLDLRRHVAQSVFPGVQAAYEKRVQPGFAREEGRTPKDKHEVRRAMLRDHYYQTWSFLQRGSQQLMWDSVIDTVERTLPTLIQQSTADLSLGSLVLDDDLVVPNYHTAHDIHQQPGGYHSEFTADDVAEGAIYDLGVPIYSMGLMGPANDALGRAVADFYRARFPETKPARVLDMGCAVGNSTVPWATVFPHAEVHGIDVAAPCLRYAHGRANAMGAAVHFSQQNAEHTNFEDGSFDAIGSVLLLHETSRSALPAIFRECYRLLKPGGMMVHLDGPIDEGQDPLQAFLGEWEVHNNNEPFYGAMREMDLRGIARDAGFAADRIDFTQAPVHVAEGNGGYMGGFSQAPVYTAVK
jgi:ubiquinone/menaquinone biosynthesis C-methylase UbiE